MEHYKEVGVAVFDAACTNEGKLYFNAVTMPPKKFVGTIRRFAKPPTDVTYFNIRF